MVLFLWRLVFSSSDWYLKGWKCLWTWNMRDDSSQFYALFNFLIMKMLFWNCCWWFGMKKLNSLSVFRSSGSLVLTMMFDCMIEFISNTFSFYFLLVFLFFNLLLFKFNACLICFPLISHVHIVAPVRFNCFISYITFKLNT